MSGLSFKKEAREARRKSKRQRKQQNAMDERRMRLPPNPNSRRKNQMPNYDVIPDYTIGVRARTLAEQTLQIVCGILNIKAPEFRLMIEKNFGTKWFKDAVVGWTSQDGSTIFVRRDCSPFEIVNTIIHETRHCWQIRNPKRFPILGKTYTRTVNREQAERDCKIFEMEFWNGWEKRYGSFDDIERILTAMRIESARAQIQARSQQYDFKQRVGLPCSSSGYYRRKLRCVSSYQANKRWKKVCCRKF